MWKCWILKLDEKLGNEILKYNEKQLKIPIA